MVNKNTEPVYMTSDRILNLEKRAEEAEKEGLFNAAIVHYEKLERMMKHDYHDAERMKRYRNKVAECEKRAD